MQIYIKVLNYSFMIVDDLRKTVQLKILRLLKSFFFQRFTFEAAW